MEGKSGCRGLFLTCGPPTARTDTTSPTPRTWTPAPPRRPWTLLGICPAGTSPAWTRCCGWGSPTQECIVPPKRALSHRREHCPTQESIVPPKRALSHRREHCPTEESIVPPKSALSHQRVHCPWALQREGAGGVTPPPLQGQAWGRGWEGMARGGHGGEALGPSRHGSTPADPPLWGAAATGSCWSVQTPSWELLLWLGPSHGGPAWRPPGASAGGEALQAHRLCHGTTEARKVVLPVCHPPNTMPRDGARAAHNVHAQRMHTALQHGTCRTGSTDGRARERERGNTSSSISDKVFAVSCCRRGTHLLDRRSMMSCGPNRTVVQPLYRQTGLGAL